MPSETKVKAAPNVNRRVTHSHYHKHREDVMQLKTESDLARGHVTQDKRHHGHWHAHDWHDRTKHDHEHGANDVWPHNGCAVEDATKH